MLNTGSKWDWSFSLGLEQTFQSREPFTSLFFISELLHHLESTYSLVFFITMCDLFPVSFKPDPVPQCIHLCQLVPYMINGKDAPGRTAHLCTLAPLQWHCLKLNSCCQSHTDQDQTWTQEAPQHSKEGWLPNITTRHVTGHVATRVWWQNAASFTY